MLRRRRRRPPTKFLAPPGAEGQDRTDDTGFFSPVLYQLSYLGPGTEGYPTRWGAWRRPEPPVEWLHGPRHSRQGPAAGGGAARGLPRALPAAGRAAGVARRRSLAGRRPVR